jgi:hypothetical protein
LPSARHFAENPATESISGVFQFNRLQTAFVVHTEVLPERASRESGEEPGTERNAK